MTESGDHLGLILEDVIKTYDIVRDEDNTDIKKMRDAIGDIRSEIKALEGEIAIGLATQEDL